MLQLIYQHEQLLNIVPIETIITSLFVFIGSLPFIFRNNESCYTDYDCPMFMKCCNMLDNRYCCTPNKYIYLKPAYVEQQIK